MVVYMYEFEPVKYVCFGCIKPLFFCCLYLGYVVVRPLLQEYRLYTKFVPDFIGLA